VQKHTLGEVGNWTVVGWQVVSGIFFFLPKIIKIWLFFKLQSKMSEMHFETQYSCKFYCSIWLLNVTQFTFISLTLCTVMELCSCKRKTISSYTLSYILSTVNTHEGRIMFLQFCWSAGLQLRNEVIKMFYFMYRFPLTRNLLCYFEIESRRSV